MRRLAGFITILLLSGILLSQEKCYKDALIVTTSDGSHKSYFEDFKKYWGHVYCLEKHALKYKKEKYYISFLRAAVSVGGCAECSEYFGETVPKLIVADAKLFLRSFAKLSEEDKKWILDFTMDGTMLGNCEQEELINKMSVLITDKNYKDMAAKLLSLIGLPKVACKDYRPFLAEGAIFEKFHYQVTGEALLALYKDIVACKDKDIIKRFIVVSYAGLGGAEYGELFGGTMERLFWEKPDCLMDTLLMIEEEKYITTVLSILEHPGMLGTIDEKKYAGYIKKIPRVMKEYLAKPKYQRLKKIWDAYVEEHKGPCPETQDCL